MKRNLRYSFFFTSLILFGLSFGISAQVEPQPNNQVEAIDSIQNDIQETESNTSSLKNAQTTFTLEEAQAYALQNNINVKVKETDVDIAKEQIREIRATGLPQVGASVRYQHFIQLPTSILPGTFSPKQDFFFVNDTEGNIRPMSTVVLDEDGMPVPGPSVEAAFGTKNNMTGSIDANQLLFSGAYLTALEAAREYVDLREMEIGQATRDAKMAVTQAYYSSLIAKEQIKLLEKNRGNLAKVLFETTQLYESGFIEQLDVDRLTLSLSNLDIQISNAERSYVLAVEALKFQMGMTSADPIELTDSLNAILPELENLALEDSNNFNPNSRVEYRVLNQQGRLNDLDIKSMTRQKYPTLAAFGSYQQTFQSDSLRHIFKGRNWFPTFVVGLQLSIPIFDGFGNKARIEQRKLQGVQVNQAKELLKQSFNLEINQAKINYENAVEQLESQKKNIDLAEKIYSVSLIKYKEGLGSSLEVNAAETELYQTQGLYMQALYNLVLAKTNLDKALGEL